MDYTFLGITSIVAGAGLSVFGYGLRYALLHRRIDQRFILIDERTPGGENRDSMARLHGRGGDGGKGNREALLQVAGRAGCVFGLVATCLFMWWGMAGWAAVALVAGAFAIPGSHWAVGQERRRRSMRVAHEIPPFLDLLQLMLCAGASLDQAFRLIVAQPRDLLPEVSGATRRWTEDVDNGLGYRDAFKRWAQRIDDSFGHELAEVFVQGLESGSDVTRRLGRISEMLVQQRLLRAREESGRRVTQLTVVMVLFFLPPFILLVAGPGLAGLTEALSVLSGGTGGIR